LQNALNTFEPPFKSGKDKQKARKKSVKRKQAPVKCNIQKDEDESEDVSQDKLKKVVSALLQGGHLAAIAHT
jgi:hypothetical protein